MTAAFCIVTVLVFCQISNHGELISSSARILLNSLNELNLIYKVESVCVRVSGIEIHTVGPILTKFGMGA